MYATAHDADHRTYRHAPRAGTTLALAAVVPTVLVVAAVPALATAALAGALAGLLVG